MLNSWDWAEDDLTERFGKNIVDKMVLILRGNIEEAH